jgi:hypothetical protein
MNRNRLYVLFRIASSGGVVFVTSEWPTLRRLWSQR